MTDYATDTYIVICKDEGAYVLATRQVYPSRAMAADYAATVAASREPLVVAGRWHQLRVDVRFS